MARNVTVRNSSVDTAGRHAFGCSGCRNFVVQDNTVTNIGYHMVNVELEAATWTGDVTLERNTYSNVYLGLLNSSTGYSGTGRGPFVVRDNVQTDNPVTCFPPVIIGAPSLQVESVTVTNNTLRTLRRGIEVEGISIPRADVRANTIEYVPGGGCGSWASVIFTNVASGSIVGNTFVNAEPVTALNSSTATVCGNRSTSTGAFSEPSPCRAPGAENDLNHDGRADICGRWADGIWCAVSTGTTGFGSYARWSNDFTDAAGWNAPEYYFSVRYPDLNGDGSNDVCMRGSLGIRCALNTGASTFGAAGLWLNDFTDAAGWNTGRFRT